ncbi:MAG: phosphoribosylamine--glycine ligase [Candidatus Omnitrophica bacterium]|nr:phosphoribosylamine--glycine ligase [Candidatus Omnitrophota bacterium]
MKILVIGSGGREHALAWKIAQSRRCEKLYAAPGSDGISKVAESVHIKADDIGSLVRFAKDKKIGLTVVGPEGPLNAGIVDAFQKEGLRIFGPTKELAALEGSKVFAKEFMRKTGVPTADFRIFDDYEEALAYVHAKRSPLVIKADGLAAGKGVSVCRAIEDQKTALKEIMVNRVFGDAGEKVVIEDCLFGEEASIIVISDGKNVVPLASSQDHKRVFDGDKGPNTGGMGAYSPAPVITDEIFKKITDTIIYPVINGLAAEGKLFKGVLYAGIMMTEAGPFVLEFNTRFGDPETQAILPRLKSDLVEAMERAIDGRLADYTLEWDTRPCVSVVIAASGYPGKYAKGMEIHGLEEVEKMRNIVVFHAGTKLGRRASDGHNLFITNGGRVLNVTALGIDYKNAIDICYQAVRTIHFDKMHYRTDIGYKAIKENG